MKDVKTNVKDESLEKVSGGVELQDDYSINYVTYKQAKSFIPKLYQQEGVEAAIEFGKNRIVDSNIWDEMRTNTPEYTVDRVYSFYFRFY